jgi:hypothetical protein
MSYYRGAQIIRPPLSSLHYLLGGIGQGFAEGMGQATLKTQREEEERKNMIATPEMQNLLQHYGVSESGPIQQLMGTQERAAESRPPKQMTSPSGAAFQLPQSKYMSMEEVANQQAEKARQVEMGQFYGTELPQALIKKEEELKLTRKYEKPEKTPGQKVQEAIEGFRVLQESGAPVENLTINGVDFYTATEKAKDLMTQQQKQQASIGDYNKSLSTAMDYRADAVKFLSGLKSGEQSMLSPAVSDFLKSAGGNVAVLDRAERMPAEKRIPLLTKEFNRVIQTKNKEIRQLAIGAKMSGANIEQIDEIDSAIFDIEEEPEETNAAKTRATTLGGKPQKEPTPEEIDDYARQLMATYTQSAQANPGIVMKPLSMDEARKIAKKQLKKR